jgi:hypothetical protein
MNQIVCIFNMKLPPEPHAHFQLQIWDSSGRLLNEEDYDAMIEAILICKKRLHKKKN